MLGYVYCTKEAHNMAQHEVNLIATEGIFIGLSKQNLLFHQCINELCDNALAATNKDSKAIIDIIFSTSPDPEYVNLYVCDNGCGMDLDDLKQALQLGGTPTSDSRLNEHGFGLKNSLATLSGGNGWWKIWSKKSGGKVVSVDGPFKSTMQINDDDIDGFPDDTFIPADCSTLIQARVKISFVRTVQGRGAPTSDLSNLRSWLIEHLGVSYRGFLLLNPQTQETSARITVSIGTDRLAVPPIEVPLGNASVKYYDVELAGVCYKLEYRYGTLDEVKRDTLIHNNKAKYYYQNNIATQGIDIRLGNRVIATRQFETIWKTEDGKSQLTRHNNYNDFVGELQIPDLPRGVLTTVNNKTDFNLDDAEWIKIFELLNETRPPKQVREKTESAIKEKWISMLKATNPSDEISDEYSVWPTATRIDVFRRKADPDGSIIIYELKVGTGTPQQLYQLKMYWDGLLISNKQPKEAVLLVEDYNTALEAMANQMNTLPAPLIDGKESLPYNFKLVKHMDVRL